jgi:GTP pyrophosphokinase
MAIEGVGNLLTRLGRCCKPVPGDDIIGYITLGQGVTIHRQDCQNIVSADNNHQDRLIEVSWGCEATTNYPVDLIIIAYNRQGLVRDITQLLTQDNIDVLALHTSLDKAENVGQVQLTIETPSLSMLSKVLARINQLPNIIEVKRQH